MSLIKCEFKKNVKETLKYYPDSIVAIVTNIIILLIVINTTGNVTLKLFGFILWILVSGVLSEASMTISTEKQLGTLQNLLVKPYSILQIIISKTIVWFALYFIKLFVFLLALSLFINITRILNFYFLVIAMIVCLGILGLSLVLSSLTLIFTKIASFEDVFSYLLLFLSGSIVTMPKAIIYSNPLSYGVHVASIVITGELKFQYFFVLFIISAVWLLFGIFFFKLVFKRSKQFSWTY